MTEDAVPALQLPLADSPALADHLASAALTEGERDDLRRFAEDGYLVFDANLADLDDMVLRVTGDLAPRYGEDRRIVDAWTFQDDVRAIATHPPILHRLQTLYGRRPIPFRTLDFDAALDVPAHSDTLLFGSIPRHFVAGVFVALEDMDGGNGPLYVHPGSHRLPDLDMGDFGLPPDPAAFPRYEAAVARVLESAGHERIALYLQRGEAVLWAANLFHGSQAATERGRTRHGLVTHYHFENCLYWVPLTSDPFLGRLTLREVIDIGRLRFVPSRHRGQDVPLESAHAVVRYPRPLPPGIEEPRARLQDLPERLRHRVARWLDPRGNSRP